MAVKPSSVTILGIPYSIDYAENPYDIDQSASLKGVVKYDMCQIRILDRGQPAEDVFQIIWHEIIHAVASKMCIESLDRPEGEDDVDKLATGINDILIRNGWINPQFGLGDDGTA